MRKYVVSILTGAAIIAFAFGKDAYDSLDQLRWCARPDDAKIIADMVTGRSSPVVDFSRVVIRELESRVKGN